MRLERPHVGYDVADLCLVQYLPKARHVTASADDHFVHALIVCRSPAGKIAGLENPLHPRAVERSGGIGVVAIRAGGLVQALAMHSAGGKGLGLRRSRLRLASDRQ